MIFFSQCGVFCGHGCKVDVRLPSASNRKLRCHWPPFAEHSFRSVTAAVLFATLLDQILPTFTHVYASACNYGVMFYCGGRDCSFARVCLTVCVQKSSGIAGAFVNP